MRRTVDATTFLALIVILGSFAYFIVRGGSDVAIITIISGSMGMVLSYFFAQHIANGAADKALSARIASTESHNVVVSEAPRAPEI